MQAEDPSPTPATALQRGMAFHQQGRLPEAEQQYRHVLRQEPANADALHLLGVLAGQVGQAKAAIELISKALVVQPKNPAFHNNLANALKDTGRMEDAAAHYRESIALQPDYVDAHANYGILLQALRRPREAEESYRRALQLREASPDVHNNLGTLRQETGRPDEAEPHYRRALALRPDYVEAHINLGEALRALGRMPEAEASFRVALALKPQIADPYIRLANVLRTMARHEEAEQNYRAALALEPSNAEAHGNLAFLLNYIPGKPPEEIYAEHLAFAQRFCAFPPPPPYANTPEPTRRLRVGYVSGDFRDHPVAFFVAPVLDKHERRQFEVFCYHNYPRGDATTARLRALADHWRDVAPLDDEAFERMVRADGIDILVDLSGHTGHSRLVAFGRRPAPVQACWLGYLNTTGLDAIGYRITDARATPRGPLDSLHCEKLVRLPGSQWCYRPPADAPDVAPPPSSATGRITFGAFTNAAKIGAPTLKLWSRLLALVPNSRLLVAGAALATVPPDLVERFTRQGIPASRLAVIPAKPFPDYLALHGSVDIILDTHPYSGGTTTCHALWMGVPVVSLTGATATSRGGASLLHAIGLPDLIAANEQDYVAIAARLAADPARLARLRAGMRKRMLASPLMDESTFTRNLEKAYRAMWLAWCKAQKPGGRSAAPPR